MSLYANLLADTLDVDMGSVSRAPYGIRTIGTDFTVPVRIRSSGTNDITAFQLLITFDPSIVRVSSDSKCSQGSGWLNKFECTTNNPVNQVLIIGYCTSTSCSSSGEVTVASISFTPVAVGVSLIS
eukprot:gene43702-58220_t